MPSTSHIRVVDWINITLPGEKQNIVKKAKTV